MLCHRRLNSNMRGNAQYSPESHQWGIGDGARTGSSGKPRDGFFAPGPEYGGAALLKLKLSNQAALYGRRGEAAVIGIYTSFR